MSEREPEHLDESLREGREPTADHPLGGPRKGRWVPALWLLGFVVVLVVVYWVGVEFLVDAG
jgi:hypothetical protein